jgi:hypothetical protein
MKMNYSNGKTTEAIIFLKSGKKKYGLLIEELQFTENFHFISNSNIPYFNETLNEDYVEIIPGTLIEAIETDLR